MHRSNKKSKLTILVTGGAGFIGSALVRFLIKETNHQVVNVDKLTYAGNTQSLIDIEGSSHYFFEKVDICNKSGIKKLFKRYKPDIVIHLAAESHVDRSIEKPDSFITTNIFGTYTLLEQSKEYWRSLPDSKKKSFIFHHVSTDEVYGDLPHPDEAKGLLPLFTEESPYLPSSPYSASKASSDHLVRAWYRTYDLPIIITNCSNNYGPYQFPEKLIPLMILNALEGKKLPIYGKGTQIRDWLYVEDHVRALFLIATQGKVGETYNIGGHNEKKNIEVVSLICEILDNLALENSSLNKNFKYKSLIEYVPDRPGHDRRYAIDSSKIKNNFNWKPRESFESGIYKTINWYIENITWCKKIKMDFE